MIANPTHVAIALEYAPPAVAVPRVLIRAVDAGARAVVERARILGVPVVRNVALARALLATAEIGRRMGVTKNTVVGKAHRLDLPARPSPMLP